MPLHRLFVRIPGKAPRGFLAHSRYTGVFTQMLALSNFVVPLGREGTAASLIGTQAHFMPKLRSAMNNCTQLPAVAAEF